MTSLHAFSNAMGGIPSVQAEMSSSAGSHNEFSHTGGGNLSGSSNDYSNGQSFSNYNTGGFHSSNEQIAQVPEFSEDEEICRNALVILETAFKGLLQFQQEIGPLLKLAVWNMHNGVKTIDGIDAGVPRLFVIHHFDIASLKKRKLKDLLNHINLLFMTTYVLLISNQPYAINEMWNDVGTLVEHYPQFASISDPVELNLLLKFRNMIKIAMLVIPAKGHKSSLLQIASKLEGANREYITGGGQSSETKNRVAIYEQEGGVQPEKRPIRRTKKRSLDGNGKEIHSGDSECSEDNNSKGTELHNTIIKDFGNSVDGNNGTKIGQQNEQNGTTSSSSGSSNVTIAGMTVSARSKNSLVKEGCFVDVTKGRLQEQPFVPPPRKLKRANSF